MNKLFVSHETALILKEKGFDEPCLAWKDLKDDEEYYPSATEDLIGQFTVLDGKHLSDNNIVKLPTYQQVIDWFETKGIFIELIADAWNMEDNDITQVKSFPSYRLFIWQVGKERPKPHHDLGCGGRYQMLDVAFEVALELI